MKIKDITGKSIEVTHLNKAIKQCRLCRDSSFMMDSEHTVGENHTFMLRQLEELKRKSKT
ncbi:MULTISPECIES: NADH-quinone oxidoreductase subunit F [Dysgonomonas]|uniref:NADH-quinone oxidoreductase subunit F n=1 Tax=Dysgonomonas TaxID=156973 RepID=UPI000A768C08|nr:MULTISPECIES: NADH-quinone oxidoreductase subunit F [Dysgonomonas]MBS5908624.1 NADH-quinone oxidoreductase subunit F [Dysgonomonas mossii]